MVRSIMHTMKIWGVCLTIFMGSFASASAQQIIYSDESNAENIRTEFEILGKVEDQILIFKNDRGQRKISVYNQDMKLVENVSLHKRPNDWTNVDFVTYPTHVWMIYQYVEKGIAYCMAAKLDKNGKVMNEPIQLDTTKLGWASESDIYMTISSDNKQNIMIFKINTKNSKLHRFTIMLFNANMQMEEKNVLDFEFEDRSERYDDFQLDNYGNLIFGRFRKRANDQLKDFTLVVKHRDEDKFSYYPLSLDDVIIDDVMLKIDNTNKKYLLNSFFTRQRRGNVEGIYVNWFDIDARAFTMKDEKVLNEDMRNKASSSNNSVKTAFNDYYINNVIIKKDGGYVLVTEELYSTQNNSAFNRWDMLGLGGYWGSPYYYSPWGWGYPLNRYNYMNNSSRRFNAENISVFSFDKNGRLEWNSVINKSQYSDNNENLLSYIIVNTGGQLHFIHNTQQRRAVLLSDVTISPDGSINTLPTMRNIMKNVEFMPKFAKQISSNVVIIPCRYRNSLIFARVEL